MRTKFWFTGILAVVLFGVIGWNGYGQKTKQPAQQAIWEYKVLFIPSAANLSEPTLNSLGAQGWELVTYQALDNEGRTIKGGNYFFKRARPGQ